MIRPLRVDDQPIWKLLWRDYLAFYQSPLPDDVTEATWQRLLDPGQPLFALIAEIDSRPIGFAHSVLHWSTWSQTPQCYLEDLFVEPGARGRGVGAALIEAVDEQARMRGADRVHWLTHETNATARALYDRLALRTGFIQYSRPR